MPVQPTTERGLLDIAVTAQRNGRVPGLVAGVARDGVVQWSAGVGQADVADTSVPLGADTQYPVASNTKTFVAVQIMQLRDEGKLGLDDPLDRHIPESTQGGVTIRQMLSHTTGMQREPVGDVWDKLVFPDRAELVTGWNQAEKVLRPHSAWHYSNLCYAMLGEVIARLDRCEWQESLQRRLLDPLELRRTTFAPVAPAAGRYYVGPFTDVPTVEPVLDKSAIASAGILSSTLADMIRWHGFLLDPDPGILRPSTLEEMRVPQIIADDDWSTGHALGFQLIKRADGLWFGHTSGAPGGVTGFFSNPATGTTGAILKNNSSASGPGREAVDLGSYLDAHEPKAPEPWRPGTVEPEDLKPLVGQWFSEGVPFAFSIVQGQLEATIDLPGPVLPSSRFVRVGDDVFRTSAGREKGELLVVRRNKNGEVAQLNWATYRFTRSAVGFTPYDEDLVD